MTPTFKGVLGAAVIGIAALLPATAVAGATPTAPKGPKPQCQASETHICTPPPDVKAKPPKGYKIPKVPRGY